MTTRLRSLAPQAVPPPPEAPPTMGSRASIRRHLLAGVAIVLLLGFGVGG